MSTPPAHHPSNREAWLNRAVDLMRNKLFKEHSFKVPSKIRISVGFPKGTRGKGVHSIGQCWHPTSSADGTAEIFIHPELEDPLRVLDVTVHELVHTINHANGQNGHGKVFKEIAVAVGLEGKMAETVASSGLIAVLKDYSYCLGPYPHKALTAAIGDGPKKQGTRMLKVVCPSCDYTVRTSQKWIDLGVPTCVCKTVMEVAV